MRNFTTLVGLILLLSVGSFTNKPPAVSPRINHVMLYVSNLEHSITFYTKAFDLRVTNRLDRLIAVQPDGTETARSVKLAFLKFPGQDFVLELAEQPVAANNLNTTFLLQHIGVDVADIDAAFKRAMEAGAKDLVAVRSVKAKGIEAKQAFLAGPDGERIELMHIISGEF